MLHRQRFQVVNHHRKKVIFTNKLHSNEPLVYEIESKMWFFDEFLFCFLVSQADNEHINELKIVISSQVIGVFLLLKLLLKSKQFTHVRTAFKIYNYVMQRHVYLHYTVATMLSNYMLKFHTLVATIIVGYNDLLRTLCQTLQQSLKIIIL